MLSYKKYIKLIKESVIYTHNISKYEGVLMKELDSIGLTFNLIIINNMSFNITLLQPKELCNEMMYDTFFSITQNQLGYYPSFYRVFLKNGMNNIFYFKEKHKTKKEKTDHQKRKNNFRFKDKEAEFKLYINDVNVNKITITFEATYEEGLYKNNLPIPKILYHISPIIYQNDILTTGLLPKSKQRSSYYPERIHFLYNLNGYKNLINKFKLNDIKQNRNKTNYNVYEIDTNGINMILHTDPNSNGCYTYDIIPHKNIKLVYNDI
jgi:hypothetical protein